MKQLYILLIFLSNILYAQQDSIFAEIENTIVSKLQRIDKYKEYEENKIINDSIANLFNTVLNNKESFNFPFDSLKKSISILESPDEQFRIFTWNTLSNRGEYENFGYIQLYNKKTDFYKLYILEDNADSIVNPMLTTLYPQKWFGAIYYNILKNTTKTETYYTVLGWDGNNLFSSKKVIDVIVVKDNMLHFGAPIFKMDDKIYKRVVFEYSAKTNMSLEYQDKKKMIVFDHLSPSKPIYTGNFEYYGPDFSYDGFSFDNDMWNVIIDIDIRNSKPETK